MAKKYINHSKFPAMITYIVAVLSLLVGLILPLSVNTIAEGAINFDNMPVLQLGGALVALGLLNALPFGAALTPLFSFEVSAFGAQIDLGAAMLIAYAFVTVLALVLLIPICISNRQKPLARKLAMLGEIFALTVLLVFAIFELQKNGGDWNLSIFIPLVVTSIMLIVQSIIYFGKSGVIKTVIYIVSILSVVVAISNIALLIPALAAPIDRLLANMQGTRPFAIVPGLYSLGETAYFGGSLIFGVLPMMPAASPELVVVNVIAFALCLLVCINILINMFGLGKRTTSATLTFNLVRYLAELVLIILLYGAVFWLMGNFGLSLIILTAICICQLIIAIVRRARFKEVKVVREKSGKKARKPAYVAKATKEYAPAPAAVNAQPAIAETAATAAPATIPETTATATTVEPTEPVATPTVIEATEPAVVADIIEVAEPVKAATAIETTEPASTATIIEIAESATGEIEVTETAVTAEVIEIAEPAETVEVVEIVEPAVVAEATAEAEYGGPTDSFIEKLSTPQKVEFFKVFLDENTGKIAGIPHYVVGGDNAKFFSSIFIFLARVRDLVSDGLMNKLYEEVNLV